MERYTSLQRFQFSRGWASKTSLRSNSAPVTELFRRVNGVTRGKVDQSSSRETIRLKQFPVRAEQGYRDLNLALPIGDR